MSSVTIAEMKSFLNAQYPDSVPWHRKVRNMPTRQVVAVYYSMKERIAKKKRKEKEMEELRKKQQEVEKQYHQIDMWEYLASIEHNTTKIKVRD